MAITKAVLSSRVLRHLGVLAAGETATADDALLVGNHVEAAYEELNKIGTIEAGFTSNAIPDWAQEAMRDRVAFLVAATFGLPAERIAQLAQASGSALAILLRHFQALTATAAADLTHKVLQKLGVIRQGEDAPAAHDKTVDDVAEAVLDYLTEDGTLAAGWTDLTNIPEWAEPFMAAMTAYRAAPLFGVVDPNILGILKAEHDTAYAEIVSRNTALSGATNVLLRNSISNHLGLTPAGVAPSVPNAALIDAGIAWWFDLADEQGTVGFTTTTIPNWAEVYLRDIIAERIAEPIGIRDPTFLQMLSQKSAIGRAEIEKRFTALGESATKAILRNMILRKLRVIGFAEDPTASQIEVAEEIIDKSFAQLRAERTVTFTTAAIPDWALLPLRDFMAYLMASTFGVPPGVISLLHQEHRAGLKEMRSQVIEQTPLTTTSIETRYF